MKEIISKKYFHIVTRNIALIFVSLVFISVFLGCTQVDLKKTDFKTDYQGVLLAGGIAYFGKIEKIGPHFIEMTDVYYTQSRQNPDTKQIDNILIKRGKELHGPDRMYISTAHVIFIEPVASDSKLGQLIKEFKAKSDK